MGPGTFSLNAGTAIYAEVQVQQKVIVDGTYVSNRIILTNLHLVKG